LEDRRYYLTLQDLAVSRDSSNLWEAPDRNRELHNIMIMVLSKRSSRNKDGDRIEATNLED
jgi:hypothetical protein